METGKNNRKSASQIGENANFSTVTALANGWVLDFMFVSLCRHFKENNFEEFNETLSILEAMCPSLKGKRHKEKTTICAFLGRVMHGKQLDVKFEEEDHVMPLMSAAKIWSGLGDTVEDESLFKTITQLLLVQSVAVCLDKGGTTSARSALGWFQNKHEFPQKVVVKLSTIVTQRKTDHPFLTSFSYKRLLETIETYLDAYLEKNPSDYLLKEAIKLTQSGSVDVMTQDSSLSEEDNDSTEEPKIQEKTVCLRTKRKLLSTKLTDVWQPDSCKKLIISVRKTSHNDLSLMTSGKSPNTLKLQKRRSRQMWTSELDKCLEQGVKRHGQGKWSRILLDYDFEGRTGTMLKDRWRNLLKTHKVG